MPAPTAAPDAELVRRAASGELAALAALFDRYGDPVHDHVARWSRDATLAADATRRAFLTLLDEPGPAQDQDVLPHLLRTARGLVVDQLRRRQDGRVDTPVATAVLAATRTDPSTPPDVAALTHATAELVWEVAAGLDERTFTVLDLHVRQGLDGPAIAAVTQASRDDADGLVDAMQEQVRTLAGATALLRLPTRDCPGLEALRREAATPLDPATASRIGDHATECITCGPRRARAVAPLPVYAALAKVRAPVAVRTGVMDAAASRLGTTSTSTSPRRMLPAGLALVLLLTLGGIASALRSNAPEPSDGPPTAAGALVASPSPSPQPSPTTTLEALPTASPEATPSPEPSVTPEPTPSPSPTPSARPSPTLLAVGIDRPAAGTVLPATAQDDQGRQAAGVEVSATVTGGGGATSVTWTSDRAPGDVLLSAASGELLLWLDEPCKDSPHVLSVTATDEQSGAVASDTVQVLVEETCAEALTVEITEPAAGETFRRDPIDKTVTFAVAGDARGEEVSWVWTTDRAPGEPVLEAQEGEVSVRIDDCTGSTTLRLIVNVEREGGSTATDDVPVNVDCGP